MRPVSEKKDRELKEELEDRYSIRNPRNMEGMENKVTRWGSGRVNHEERLIFHRTKISDNYKQIASKVSEFVTDLGLERIYSIAFEDEQYANFDESFKEKFDNKSAAIEPSEIPQITDDIVEFMVVPESLEWIIVFDHEGHVSFNGGEEFIEEVKDFFDDWEKLSEFPDGRKKQ